MIHFGLIFVCGAKYESKFIFAYGHPIVPVPLVANIILSPLNCLCTFVENQLFIHMWFYFWTLFCSTHLCTFMTIPHFIDYYSFITNLEVRYCKSSKFVHFLGPFYMNIRITLLIFTKKPAGILIGIASNI